ncbi:3-keto-5-aminohexanoate cleavage protein [Nocardia nova]|uniref:3-keto-5-aminohexanoate cleavage protein n=1 Tax=Nocardia nova TaxID=37330 RepID=UPI0015E32C7E|nr:3-keto-5-aminohexanoate cleavage protein [Nocardia nova]
MLHLRPLAESGRMMMFAFYPGGNLRMGLEDPLRTVGHTNTDMIKQAIALADEVGRPIATYQNALDVLSS